ncbi:hypothetical protein B5M09_013822 [Aphanomyces astaci]|uniref:Uncharacterized protein n=1 Tax=Aphanomyces astaci TaxID=112090 RepID=A0A425DQ40_APHAT|nr:hypothetical protein B5M09_013822 [Aphanomyces astaci]
MARQRQNKPSCGPVRSWSLPPLCSSGDESSMPRSGNDNSSRPLVAPKHAPRTTSGGSPGMKGSPGGVERDIEKTTSDEATRLKTYAERQEILKACAEERKWQVEAKLKALHAPKTQAYKDQMARRQAEETIWLANKWAKAETEEAVELELAKALWAKVETYLMKLEERRRLMEAELAAMRADKKRGMALE